MYDGNKKKIKFASRGFIYGRKDIDDPKKLFIKKDSFDFWVNDCFVFNRTFVN